MAKETNMYDRYFFQLLDSQPYAALEQIFAHYGGSLEKYIRRFIYDDDDLVKDVLNETLIVIWEKRQLVAKLEAPVYWMQRVAKNKALYYIRGEAKYNKISLDNGLDMASGQCADDIFAYNELEMLILEACEELPPQDRELVIKSKFEGRSNKELMATYGMAEQTVKNKLSRALKVIRKKLKDLMGLFV
ncbi:RNA polymerase sigma factor [Sphingobacterium multivorum]|uniref:RNA polymerase sigma factor n=1 Tax=Sphingobacterium multivorum TaxID=28454 RepID=UPI0028AB2374|nr:sigma-70 family RNA polymerase sigma factor [Sphingobacterium multivorum]